MDRYIYNYRKLTQEERQLILKERRKHGFPLHAPPHLRGIKGTYLITSACYEHRSIFIDTKDLTWLENEVLKSFDEAQLLFHAWVFLPNHYHILAEIEELGILSEILRTMHSRIAKDINTRHGQRGRKVWYRYSDRFIRSQRHYLTSINYIHFNPVKHGYVDRMETWSWSSIHEFSEKQGNKWIENTWKAYPLMNFGKGWDW